ncbi:ChbG/HpnK family deacetylase [Candidatus Peribacteria bacterium]|nr:ChbG/HpnK family deacetylase [Candidatus Peribacteria bacterium]
MRRLVINADDVGINPSRDHGILETFERGVVSSATVLVNMSDAERAVELARRQELPLGLHFNISEGFPLSPQKNVASLLSAEGVFLDRKRMRRALDDGEVDPRHIAWEFRAQMQWLSQKIHVTHLDSHHNFHAHPVVANVLAPLLAQYDVRWTRITDEPPPADHIDLDDEKRSFLAMMVAQAQAARPLYEVHGIGSTDHFRGFGLAGNASKKAFRQLLRSLPEGTTELMVHPGQRAPEGADPFSSDPQRETERDMLLDEEMPTYLAQQKIELISYGDL